jgi:hypothetical protein
LCLFLLPPGVLGDLGETGALSSPSSSREEIDARGVGRLDDSHKSNDDLGVSTDAIAAFGVVKILATEFLGIDILVDPINGEEVLILSSLIALKSCASIP